MPNVMDRYEAATSYVRRAIAAGESPPVRYSVNPINGLIEWYAGPTKTEPAKRELTRIEARWLRATSDTERSKIARDAELLADRVQEALPGAPQDRQRTNLSRDEKPTSTPATSYGDELAREAELAWGRAKGAASSTADGARSLATWLLIGGAVVVSWRAFGYLDRRERRLGAKLNEELGRTANHKLDRGES